MTTTEASELKGCYKIADKLTVEIALVEKQLH